MPYDFETDYTLEQRKATLGWRTTVRNKIDGNVFTQAQLDAMKNLLVDVTHQLIDEPQMSADDRETALSFTTEGVPMYPEYRHEYLMSTDFDYHDAWAYDHAERFRQYADASADLMESVVRGQERWPYREADPEIVDRSLLRHGFRELREGEVPPSPIVGKRVPPPWV